MVTTDMPEAGRNLIAEQAVLAVALWGHPDVLMALDPGEFTDPRHQAVAIAVRDLVRRGEPVSPVTVKPHVPRVPSTYLFELHGAMWVVREQDSYYGEQVRHATRIRELWTGALRTLDALHADLTLAEDIAVVQQRAAHQLQNLPEPLGDDPWEDPPTVADLLNSELPDEDWLVPDLIARMDRYVFVAGEGAGKSLLIQQMVTALASGCHPLTGKPTGKQFRVMVVDCENTERQLKARWSWIGDRFTHAETGWARNIVLHVRLDGLDLPGKDYAWFVRECRRASPDVIVVTPAYKLTGKADTDKDRDMMGLLLVLDEVRTRHNAAVLIEQHAGHKQDSSGNREWRPFGSSVWLRWPEGGFAISRADADGEVLKLGQFRRFREPRPGWPRQIRYGRPGELPWTPVESEGYYDRVIRIGKTMTKEAS